MQIDPQWEYVSDGVMGGQSEGQLGLGPVKGRDAARLTGTVSLANNGGFIQIAFDLAERGAFDASGFSGIAFETTGNGENYDIRLRTTDLARPWQSYRAAFTATGSWQSVQIPFSDFAPHRTEAPFDPSRLRRIGVLAIGHAFEADVAIAGLRFYD